MSSEIAKKHSAIVDGLIKFGLLFSAIISIVDESTFFFDVLFYSIFSLFGLAIVLTIVWSIKGQFAHSYDIDPHSYDVDPLEEGRAFKEQSLFACKQAAA